MYACVTDLVLQFVLEECYCYARSCGLKRFHHRTKDNHEFLCNCVENWTVQQANSLSIIIRKWTFWCLIAIVVLLQVMLVCTTYGSMFISFITVTFFYVFRMLLQGRATEPLNCTLWNQGLKTVKTVFDRPLHPTCYEFAWWMNTESFGILIHTIITIMARVFITLLR